MTWSASRFSDASGPARSSSSVSRRAQVCSWFAAQFAKLAVSSEPALFCFAVLVWIEMAISQDRGMALRGRRDKFSLIVSREGTQHYKIEIQGIGEEDVSFFELIEEPYLPTFEPVMGPHRRLGVVPFIVRPARGGKGLSS